MGRVNQGFTLAKPEGSRAELNPGGVVRSSLVPPDTWEESNAESTSEALRFGYFRKGGLACC